MKHLLLIFLLSSFDSYSQNADINLLHSVNRNSTPFLDNTFKIISNTTSPVSFALPLGVLAVGFIEKDKTTKINACQIGGSLFLASGVSAALKYSVNRTRPFITYSFIEKKSGAGSASFPSGHTTIAFAAATSLSLCYPKWYVIAPSYLWACSVAYSRMYLGVHYPTDVLAGMIIGSGVSVLVYEVRRKIEKK